MRKFLGAAVISARPDGLVTTYTVHSWKGEADRAVRSHIRSKRYGLHTRMAYRVNVYAKGITA